MCGSMTSRSDDEASLRTAARPANPAPTIATLRGPALESNLGFIDRPAPERAIHVLCRPRLTGETFESSATAGALSAAWMLQTAACEAGLLLAPSCNLSMGCTMGTHWVECLSGLPFSARQNCGAWLSSMGRQSCCPHSDARLSLTLARAHILARSEVKRRAG